MPDHYFRMGYGPITSDDLAQALAEKGKLDFLKRLQDEQLERNTLADVSMIESGVSGLNNALTTGPIKGLAWAGQLLGKALQDPWGTAKRGAIALPAAAADLSPYAPDPEGYSDLANSLAAAGNPLPINSRRFGNLPNISGDPLREAVGLPKFGEDPQGDWLEAVFDPTNLFGTGFAKGIAATGAKLASSVIPGLKSLGLTLLDPTVPTFIKSAMWLHASPHKYDLPSSSFRYGATGEGAQAFGHGWYSSGYQVWTVDPATKAGMETGGSHGYYRGMASRHEDLELGQIYVGDKKFDDVSYKDEDGSYIEYSDAHLFERLDQRRYEEGGVWEEGVDTARDRLTKLLVEAEPRLKDFPLNDGELNLLDTFIESWSLWDFNKRGMEVGVHRVDEAYAQDQIILAMQNPHLSAGEREFLKTAAAGKVIDLSFLMDGIAGRNGLDVNDWGRALAPEELRKEGMFDWEIDHYVAKQKQRQMLLRILSGGKVHGEGGLVKGFVPPGELISKNLRMEKGKAYSYAVDHADSDFERIVDLDELMADQTPEVKRVIKELWEPYRQRDDMVHAATVNRIQGELDKAVARFEELGGEVRRKPKPSYGKLQINAYYQGKQVDYMLPKLVRSTATADFLKLSPEQIAIFDAADNINTLERQLVRAKNEQRLRLENYLALEEEETAAKSLNRLTDQIEADLQGGRAELTDRDREFIEFYRSGGPKGDEYFSEETIKEMLAGERVKWMLSERGIVGNIMDDGLSRNKGLIPEKRTRNLIFVNPERDIYRVRRAQLGEDGQHVGNRHLTVHGRIQQFADDLPGESIGRDELRGLQTGYRDMTPDQAEDIIDQLFDQGQRHEVVAHRGRVIQENQIARAAQMAGIDNLRVVNIPDNMLPYVGTNYGKQYQRLVEWVHVDDLIELRGNRLGKTDLDKLKQEIKDAGGLEEPVIIHFGTTSRQAKVGEGNHRVQAAKEMGYEYVPVRVIRNINETGVARSDIIPPAGEYFKGDASPSEVFRGLRIHGRPEPKPPTPQPTTPQIGDFPTTTIRHINKTTREEGGMTVNLATGEKKIAGQDEGFSVGITNNDPMSKKPALITPGDKPATRKELQEFVDRNPELKKPNFFLGTWREMVKIPDGKGGEMDIAKNIYYDVAQVLHDLRKAAWEAQKTNQIAVFELKTFETHNIGNWEEFINSPELHRRLGEMAERGNEFLKQFPMKWWQTHGTIFEEIYGREGLNVIAGFIAATSPKSNPHKNVQIATEYMRRYLNGEPLFQPNWRATDDVMGGFGGPKPGSGLGMENQQRKAVASALGQFKGGPKTQRMFDATLGDPTAVPLDLWWSRMAEDPTGLWKPNADNPEKVFLGPDAGTWQGVQGKVSDKNNRARIFDVVLQRYADEVGEEVGDIGAVIWTGMRETARTTGELFGMDLTKSARQNAKSPSVPLAVLFDDLVRAKAKHLGISEGEMRYRLSTGKGNLLSIIVATPLGAYVLSETMKRDPSILPDLDET